MSHSQFQSKAEAQVKAYEKLPEQQADGHPIPAGMVLGACIEAVSIHCERASNRRRIYLHIMDQCRVTGQNDALKYGDGLDPLYDVLLTLSDVSRKAFDDTMRQIADEDDHGAGDRPYRMIASQTIDMSSLVGA